MDFPFYITWSNQDYELKEVTSSQGATYTLANGSQLIDLSSTSYHMGLGHSYGPIIDKIKKQLDDLVNASPKFNFKLKEEVSNELLNFIGLNGGKIFYTVSGAESVENAIKMARHVTGRQVIVSREKCYHGATLGALSLTGDWRNPPHKTIDEWTLRIPNSYDDPTGKKAVQKIENYGPEKIAAICIEPIIGGNGVHWDDQKWWDAIDSLCKKHNILLIVDEVITGFKRTIKNFGFEHFNITPDIICMAKMITSGHVPFGAIWTGEKVQKFYENNILTCGLTNYAHPLGLAATSAVLETLKDQQLDKNILKLESAIISSIEHFKKLKLVNDVRQFGLLMAINIKEAIPLNVFIDGGVYVCSNHDRDIIVAPALNMDPEQLNEGLNKLANIISQYCETECNDDRQ